MVVNGLISQECQLVAPLQLYFSWNTAFSNHQVSLLLRRLREAYMSVLATHHDLYFLRTAFIRSRVSHVLYVSIRSLLSTNLKHALFTVTRGRVILES
jgi:hypothetical protein